jgi:hypothetical protein
MFTSFYPVPDKKGQTSVHFSTIILGAVMPSVFQMAKNLIVLYLSMLTRACSMLVEAKLDSQA